MEPISQKALTVKLRPFQYKTIKLSKKIESPRRRYKALRKAHHAPLDYAFSSLYALPGTLIFFSDSVTNYKKIIPPQLKGLRIYRGIAAL